jgi:hypothetical protein
VAEERGLPATMQSVFMSYTGRSLDDDIDPEERRKEEEDE